MGKASALPTSEEIFNLFFKDKEIAELPESAHPSLRKFAEMLPHMFTENEWNEYVTAEEISVRVLKIVEVMLATSWRGNAKLLEYRKLVIEISILIEMLVIVPEAEQRAAKRNILFPERKPINPTLLALYEEGKLKFSDVLGIEPSWFTPDTKVFID